MIELIPISKIDTGIDIIYQLLKERTPEQSISHKKMPTLEEHTKFVESNPYLAWYFIMVKALTGKCFFDEEVVGSIYLTQNREIGISIFRHHQGQGYGEEAVKNLMEMYPGKFYANINPNNKQSIEFFSKFGAKHIQNTYAFHSC